MRQLAAIAALLPILSTPPAAAQSFIKDLNLPPFEQCVTETAAVVKLTHPYRDFDLTEVTELLRTGLETDTFADVDFAKVEAVGSDPDTFRTEFKTLICSSLHDYYIDGTTPKKVWGILIEKYLPVPTAEQLKAVALQELGASILVFTSSLCGGAMKIVCKDEVQ